MKSDAKPDEIYYGIDKLVSKIMKDFKGKDK
jgi:hypothetical protein